MQVVVAGHYRVLFASCSLLHASKMKFVACLFLFGVVLCGGDSPNQQVQPIIPVTVYYESLCPDSIKFYTSQLFPTYTSPLKKYFSLKLVPFGKASYKRIDASNVEFTCHHGPNECYGNKVQGCVLKHVPEEMDQIKLINCLMAEALGLKNGTYPTVKCGSSTNIDVASVLTCANGIEGNEVLIEHGSQTEKLVPSLTSVPTIVFNENFIKADSDLSEKNFKAALCAYINKGDHVHECHGVNATPSVMPLPVGLVLLVFCLLGLRRI